MFQKWVEFHKLTKHFFQLIILTSILTSILDENLSKFFQLIILTDVLTFSILTSIVNEDLIRLDDDDKAYFG